VEGKHGIEEVGERLERREEVVMIGVGATRDGGRLGGARQAFVGLAAGCGIWRGDYGVTSALTRRAASMFRLGCDAAPAAVLSKQVGQDKRPRFLSRFSVLFHFGASSITRSCSAMEKARLNGDTWLEPG